MRFKIRFVVLLFALPLLVAHAQFDIIIKNGRIVDGSGNPWYKGDVGIRDGRIAALGSLDPGQGTRVLDAAGMMVAPGFIDVHPLRRRTSTDSNG